MMSTPHIRRPRSKKPRATLTLLSALGLTASLTACAGSGTGSNAEPQPPGSVAHLKMADSYSLTHPVGKGGTQPFLDAMDKAPSIDIEYFDSGQMGKQADIPSVLNSGVVDLAVISPSYVSSTFPLSSIGDMPGYGSDSCVTSYALRELVQPGGVLYEEELKEMNFLPLWTGSIPGYEAMTSGKDPSHPSNFNGSVLRSTGGALDRVIDQIGAAGVGMPIGDLYEAMSRGTVEGTLASPISITPYGLEDVINASTLGADQGNFTFFYGINIDTWNSLNQEQKDELMKAADASQQSVCDGLNAARDTSIEAMREGGVTFHDVSDNSAEWEATATPVRESFLRDAESRGLPAQQVIDDYEAALARNQFRAQDSPAEDSEAQESQPQETPAQDVENKE